jgi:hypothetical protein
VTLEKEAGMNRPGVPTARGTPTIRLTKIEVARRQFHAAIEMWFADGDPVAIHTLTSAAHEIVAALCRKKGIPDHLFDSDLVRPELRGKWNAAMRAPQNFFKHADKDPNDEIDFAPSANDLRLMFVLTGFQALGERIDDWRERVYWTRMNIEQPGLMKEDIFAGKISAADVANIRRLSRPRFFEAMRLHFDREAAGKAGGRIPTF